MELMEKTVESQVLFSGKIITVRLDRAQLPNGRIASREVVEHPGGVTVIPVPMMEISLRHENERGSNIVAVGAAVGATGIMPREMMVEGIETYFAKYGKANNAKNIAVFNEGYDLVRKELAR